ncbi:MAG: response regulator transcription factor [Pseudomonadota bacterium]
MGSTVYLIDKDAVFKLGIEKLLSEYHDVKVVGSSKDIESAFLELRICKPDLVIFDPGTRVYESFPTLRKLKLESPTTRFVMFGDSMNPITAHEAIMMELDAYALKPINVEELKALLARVFAGEKHITDDFRKLGMGSAGQSATVRCGTELRNGRLSDRETQILVRTVNGQTAADIAEEFNISIKTAEWHRRNVYSKLQVKNVAQLTKLALRAGLIGLD